MTGIKYSAYFVVAVIALCCGRAHAYALKDETYNYTYTDKSGYVLKGVDRKGANNAMYDAANDAVVSRGNEIVTVNGKVASKGVRTRGINASAAALGVYASGWHSFISDFLSTTRSAYERGIDAAETQKSIEVLLQKIAFTGGQDLTKSYVMSEVRKWSDAGEAWREVADSRSLGVMGVHTGFKWQYYPLPKNKDYWLDRKYGEDGQLDIRYHKEYVEVTAGWDYNVSIAGVAPTEPVPHEWLERAEKIGQEAEQEILKKILEEIRRNNAWQEYIIKTMSEWLPYKQQVADANTQVNGNSVVTTSPMGDTITTTNTSTTVRNAPRKGTSATESTTPKEGESAETGTTPKDGADASGTAPKEEGATDSQGQVDSATQSGKDRPKEADKLETPTPIDLPIHEVQTEPYTVEGGGECIKDKVYSTPIGTVTIPLSMVCDYVPTVRKFVLLVAYVLAAITVLGA